jgi:hydroxymethylpyrimidine pyrophosphatase-like HAD family hydrolase
VGIATGRAPVAARPFVAPLHADLPSVVYNGVALDDSKEVRVLAGLEPAQLRALLAVTRGATGVEAIAAYVPAGRYLDGSGIQDQNPLLGNLDAFARWLDTPKNRHSALLAIILTADRAARDALLTALQPVPHPDVRIVITTERSLELVAVGANKARGIAALLKSRGYSLADVLAFGNRSNDTEMLAESGAGFAMARNDESARSAALAVIGDNNSDTIARVIRRLALTDRCRAAGPPRQQAGLTRDRKP